MFCLKYDAYRVVTVPVVDVDVVLERPGSKMFKTQNIGFNENKVYREIFNRIIILLDAALLENKM